MEKSDKMQMTDEELEARFRCADFSAENPGLDERLREKIRTRISAPKGLRALMKKGVALSPEEMDMAVAAKGGQERPAGGPFTGFGTSKIPDRNGKR